MLKFENRSQQVVAVFSIDSICEVNVYLSFSVFQEKFKKVFSSYESVH